MKNIRDILIIAAVLFTISGLFACEVPTDESDRDQHAVCAICREAINAQYPERVVAGDQLFDSCDIYSMMSVLRGGYSRGLSIMNV